MNMKNIALVLGSLLLLVGVHAALADQVSITRDEYENSTRDCDLTGVVPQKVTTSGTSGAIANAVGKGKVRVTCSVRAFMAVGANGVTASSTTGHAMPAGAVEYFWTRSGYKYAFIQDVGAGLCEVAECK